MKRFNGRQGLTLIECLVALVILGVGIVGVAGCLTAALISNQKASDMQLATAIGQNVIEDMRSLGFGSITVDNFPASITKDSVDSDLVQEIADQVAQLHSGLVTTTITENYNGSDQLKKVVVVVSWKSRNLTAARVRLETVVGNRQS